MSTDLSNYKKLDEIEHILIRPGIFVGSVTNTSKDHFVPVNGKMELQTVDYNPGLLKLFDELISNSVDEHIRNGTVNRIDVNYSTLTGEITVKDNGGIPVKKHPEHKTYIPTMIFSELRTGSNFNDEQRFGAGQNGYGVKLVSIFSTSFRVETCDGTKKLTQTFTNNLSDISTPKITKSKDNGTTVTFTPDYERLKCELDEGNIKRIEKRVYDVAGCNPGISVFLNGEKISIKSFKDYVSMFVDSPVVDSNEHWEVAVGANSDDNFQQVSFVNGVDTYNGGTHIDYIANQVTTKLREYIKKKHKIDVKPNNIKQQMALFINCRINAPVFTSQTKEYLSTDPKEYETSFEVTDKFINKIVKSEVVQKVLDWAEAQQRQKELSELRKMNKQTQNVNFLKKIVKFDDATSKNRKECSLYIVEGDSAGKAILSARNSKIHGVYPLKGKPLNVRDVKVSKLTSNQEFANLMSIIGLRLGHKVTSDELRFGEIVIACDADPDGQHIIGLVLNMFQQFWPNLITEGVIRKLVTPQILAYKGKKVFEFFNRSEYDAWSKDAGKHNIKYFKGLGSWPSSDFKRFLTEEKYTDTILAPENDFSCVDLAFDKKKADERKAWLMEN